MLLAVIFLLVVHTSEGDARRIPTPVASSSTTNESPPMSKDSRTLAQLFFSRAPALPSRQGFATLGAGRKPVVQNVASTLQRNIVEEDSLVRRADFAPPKPFVFRDKLATEPWWNAIDTTKMHVMIAGGGIGGLFAALVLQNDGHDIAIFEKTKEYRPFGGPIQIATNALEAIKRIDSDVHQQILDASTVIGDRTNGLKDGISNEWFATFDLLTPAVKVQGEPSVVIDRPVLQDILLSKVGKRVTKGLEVVGYEQKPDGVGVIGHLADGTKHEADILIGSDGIHSKVREKFYENPTDAVWSGYTCFAGIANCVPDDIKEVGYKVFLGSKKYFVSVDVGGGRIQWYAFLNIPPRTAKPEGDVREWLKKTQFEGWTEDVQTLIECTDLKEIEQRDLYDRRPELTWADGNVCLLGDAAHPMMPNLGQGGGMAIEDALVLGQEVRAMKYRKGLRGLVPYTLKEYADKRAMRAASVQGMSRISSAFLFQYHSPTTIESIFPPKIKNLGLRSAITRSFQGFLQHIAFPLQFEFLFGFPGNAVEPEVFDEGYRGTVNAESDFLAVLDGKISGKDFWRRYLS